jgi:hypothetical protein
VLLSYILLLEMKEAWKRQRNGSDASTGFIVQDGALQRGTWLES